MANSLFWPPHRPHAYGRHTVQECPSGYGTQEAGTACRRAEGSSGGGEDVEKDRERSGRRRRQRRPPETGGERRTSVKKSEIGTGSDKCFLTPCEERRGVCLAKRPGKGTEEEEERTEEREEERG